MPTNSESLNRELFRLLSKYKPKPLDAEGKATPVPEEADIFKFEFTKDGEDYGTVYVTLDDERSLTVYFGDDVTESPGDKTPGLDYDDSWSGLLHQLSSWRMTKGLRGFKTQNKDRVGDDMARRNHMRNKDKIAEGYYPMGKSRSYSDAVPSVKIVIEHSRVIEEGEQRYRNINRIFLENQDGERYLLDTKKPGIARVYARHIAEGGKVNDDRWSHIGNLCEEYQKMAGFVRATRNGQFNESAQALVNEGLEHYQSLRESLSRMTGKRGYNAYFESWTPPLMEDGTEENNLNELFVQETLDPRIESVMPILNRIHKKVSESIVDKEVNKLAEWADSLVEGPAVDANANSPTGSQSPALAHYADQLDHDASVQEDESIKSNNPGGIPESLDQYSPVTQAITRRILMQHPDLLQKYGPEKVGDAIDDVAEFVGDVEEIGSSDVSGWVKQVTQSLDGHEGMEEAINTGASLQRFKNDPRGNQKLPATQKKELDEFDIDTLNQLASHPMAGTLAAAGGAAIGATIGKGITKAADWYKNRQEKKAQDHDMRGNKVAEGSHEEQVASLAAYNEKMAGENPPIELGLREVGNWAKVGHYGDPIKTAWFNIAKYGIRNNKFNDSVDKAMSAIGDFPDKYDLSIPEIDTLYSAYETVYDQWEQSRGAANENFINQADQAVVSEEDEMAEGEHTQHAMRGRNPGADEFEHDFENDKIDNIHDKISKMLKKLSKPNHEPNMKDTDLGSTVLDEVDLGQYDAVKSTSNSGTTPEQEKEFRKKVQAYGQELDQRQKEKQKEKDNVKEGQEDFDAILRIIRK